MLATLPGTRRWPLVAGLLLAGVVLVAYANTVDAPFVYDDTPNIVENPDVRSLSAALARPLRRVAFFSFALNYAVGGYHPLGYHLVNILIHWLNGLLLFLLTRVLLSREDPPAPATDVGALAAALLFVAHPIQTQAVTYLVQRMASLATLFYLIALLCYLAARSHRSGRWRAGFGALALIAWSLALGSKENAGTLPLAVLLIEWVFYRGASTAWLRASLLPLSLGALLVLGVVWLYLGDDVVRAITAGYGERDFTLTERVLTQFRVVLTYVSLIVVPLPSRLNLLHDVSLSRSLFEPPTTLLACAVIVSSVVAAVAWARRAPELSFAVLWFFLHLVIESSVIALDLMYEHRVYLPLVGPCVAVGHVVRRVWSGADARRRRALVVVSTALLLGLVVATVARNHTWTDRVALWRDVATKSPTSPRALKNYGVALNTAGRPEQALRPLMQANELRPDDADIHSTLGSAYAALGQAGLAERHLQRAQQLEPDSAAVQVAMGVALFDAGRVDEAVARFRAAIRIDPREEVAHTNLGLAYANQGNYTLAERAYRRAILLNPQLASAHGNLGAALMRMKRWDDAAESIERALEIDPRQTGALNNLGVCRVKTGRYQEAFDLFSRVLAIDPEHRDARANLERLSSRLRAR